MHRMDVPKPGQHPHADLMGMLLLSKVAFGLFALVLSGILVVNLLTALLASQVRQIGVMKAVGGTRWPIARIYLAQALLLGVAACVVAVPLGMWGSRVLCRYLAVFLNFDIASFAVPAWVYLLEALVGLLVPLLAAAYPVARGTRISVREALADYGVADGGFGTTAFDRALASLSGTTRPLLLSLRNAFRRRARLGTDARDALRRRCLLHVGAQRACVARANHRPTVRLGEVRPLGRPRQPAAARGARARRAPDARCLAGGRLGRYRGDTRTRGRRAARERGDSNAALRGTGPRARHGRSVPGSLHAHRPAGGIGPRGARHPRRARPAARRHERAAREQHARRQGPTLPRGRRGDAAPGTPPGVLAGRGSDARAVLTGARLHPARPSGGARRPARDGQQPAPGPGAPGPGLDQRRQGEPRPEPGARGRAGAQRVSAMPIAASASTSTCG